MDIPIETKAIRHALQKQTAKIKHGFETKTAKAVNRKGIKPVTSRLTIDTGAYKALRIKEKIGVPAYRERSIPQIKPAGQQIASKQEPDMGYNATASTPLSCAKANPPRNIEIISKPYANSGGITRHGHKIPKSKCNNTILQNLQKFKLF